MRRLIAVLLACTLTVTASWAAEPGPLPAPTPLSIYNELPELGSPATAVLSRADGYQVGLMENMQLRRQGLVMNDPFITSYLQNLGMQLASQAKLNGQTFHYQAIRSSVVNAETSFGGFVYIFSGLILATGNEAQLAAVMAHETGHVLQRHIARQLQAQGHLSVAATAGMLAAILIGAASGGSFSGTNAAEGALALGQAVSMQRSINFTRSEEIEADAVGIHLLAGAGYDPYEMATFFQTMEQQQGLQGSEIPALLINHPVFPARIAAARALAAQLRPAHPRGNSPQYAFIKERVRVLAAGPNAQLARYYAALGSQRELTPAERYGQALVQIRARQAAKAVPTLRALVARRPQLTMLYSALGHALAESGQDQAALQFFATAEQLFPRNVGLTVRYAKTLMQLGRPSQAHALLLDLFNNVDPTPPQIELTAQAASQAGDNGDAYYYMSQYQLMTGDLMLANQQLELALATPGINGEQRARYLAMLHRVHGWIRQQQQTSAGRRAEQQQNQPE